MAFVFYDTETTGTDTAFDQIVQFGAIRTDDDLNELDRYEIRCRLAPHIVPAPGALKVTQVTPSMLTDPSLPSHFEAMQLIHAKMKEWSPAIFLGYNSISFDENLMRQAFYQTLQPIYLTNTGGNARGDVMRMLHATNIFVPNVVAVPLKDDGKPTFKLDMLAPANGFAHQDAHEAIADVEATIYMSQLMRDRVPEIWLTMIDHASKQNTIRFIEENDVFAMADVYFGRSYSWLVTSCGSNPGYNAENAAFDLSFSPDDYFDLSVEELIGLLKGSPKPIRVIRANSQPILMPEAMALEETNGTVLSSGEIRRRADQIRSNEDFHARVGQALANRYEDEEPSPYVEKKIYDGFPSNSDETIMAKFQTADWQDRLELGKQLGDARLRDLARRQIYFEQPELLSDTVRQELDAWLSDRLLTADPDVPWRTIPEALEEVDELLNSTEGEEHTLMVAVKEYILELADKLAIN